MKKALFITGIISLLVLSSCKLDVQEEKKLNRPETELISGGVMVRGTYGSSDVKYINVFRQDVTGTTPAPAINIGVVFKAGFDKNDKTYSFTDKTAIAGKKYKYYCRYCDEKNTYYSTNLTDTVIPETANGLPGTTAESDLLVNTGTATFTYNESTKNFTITGTLTMPSNTPAYDLSLVIKSEAGTQAFELAESSNITSPMTFSMTSLLPESFLNTEIQLLGLIGQYKEYSDPADPTSAVKRIFWTGLKDFTLTNTDTTPVAYTDNKITVSQESGDNGIDIGY